MKIIIIIISMLMTLTSCSDSNSSKPKGSEGGPCYENGTCDGDLVCLSNFCVDIGTTNDSDKTDDSGNTGDSGSDDDSGNTGDSASDDDTGNTGDSASDDDSGNTGDSASDDDTGNTGDSASDDDSGNTGDSASDDDEVSDDDVIENKDWTVQWGTGMSESAYSVATDKDGNIFVTGYIEGNLDGTNAGGSDIFLTKWNADGTKAWTKQWGTAGDDSGNSVAVDSNGNIFVTGYIEGALDGNTNLGSTDIFLTKWNKDGTKAWTKQWGTAGDDYAESVVVDKNDNIFVTGDTEGNLDGNTALNGSSDIFLTKWDTDGNKEWTQMRGTDEDEYVYSSAVDSNGNIFVTGETEGAFEGFTNAGGSDIFLTKWDTDGTEAWTKQWGTAEYDYGSSIAVDNLGNIFVTGYTEGALDGNTNMGRADLFLTKWDTDGTKVWTQQWGTAEYDYINSVVVDNNNNIFVTGDTSGNLDGNTALNGSSDIFLTKWDTDGNKEWTQMRGTDEDEYVYSSAVDSNGNIFVTGHTEGAFEGFTNLGSDDIFLIKWGQNKDWTVQWGTSEHDQGSSVAVDKDGNIFTTGDTGGALDGTNAGGSDIFLIKWNPDRSKAWTRQWGTGEDDYGDAVAVDSNGNIFVTGNTNGAFPGYLNPYDDEGESSSDIFLAKWNADGTLAWTKQWGIEKLGDYGTSVAVDKNDNIFVTGVTTGDLDGNTNMGSGDIFLTKWNPDGTKAWTKLWGTSKSDQGESVAVDSNGNIFATGETHGDFDGSTNSGELDIFLTKWDPEGNKEWAKLWGTDNFDYGESVAVDSNGYIFVAGRTLGNLDGNTNMGRDDLFLTKWNTDGTKAWTKQWGTAKDDYMGSVVVDNNNNIFVTGTAGENLDGNTNLGSGDIFLTKWGTDGNKAWTQLRGTDKFDSGNSVAVDKDSNVFVTGYTEGAFEGFTNAGESDIFLIKWGH